MTAEPQAQQAPTPFEAWDPLTLASLARDLYEENKHLRVDLSAALQAYRQEVAKTTMKVTT